MINWTIIEETGLLPDVSANDEFRKSQQYSDRVLIWIDNPGEWCPFEFATYIHPIKAWNIEGRSGGKWKIKAWSYVPAPVNHL